MARASIRWAGLLISIITALVILTSIFSPATLLSAQDVAQDWREKFQDNAAPGGMQGNLGIYAPKVYDQVQSWWNRLFPDDEELRGLQLLDDTEESRCRIYTYYDKTAKSEDTEALLQVWLKAWWAVGMSPVILTNDMSLKHAEYSNLHKNYDGSGLDLEKLDAIMAMDQMKFEGMLVSNFVFPMARTDDALLQQMRQCQVLDALSRYIGSGDHVMRGSSLAYGVLIKALLSREEALDRQEIERKGFGAVPGFFPRDLEATETFAIYDPATVKELYPSLYKGEPVEQGGKSFTFSKHQLASLVNRHLQDNFLSNFQQGIEVLAPKLGITDSEHLYKPAMVIAMELLRCNLTPLLRSCPPTRKSKKDGCFRCDQLVSSAVIRPVEGFAPKNSTFLVGNVAHPLTLLAVGQDSRDFSAAAIRNSPRDVWSKKTLTPTLRPKAGAVQGLIFLSDSLFKNEDRYLPDTHIWATFERPNLADLEYEVGFILPELRTSLEEADRASAEKSPKFHKATQETKAMINDREIKDRSDVALQKAVEISEAWAQYDAGAHQLIGHYVHFKGKKLEHMKAVNRGAFAVSTLV